MSNPRTPIDELELAGSPNLLRAQKRVKADANVVLTPEAKSEIERLTELIARAMKCCHRGQTVDGKPNPAFQNLAALIRSRELLYKGRKPGRKSAAEILAAADEMLRAN